MSNSSTQNLFFSKNRLIAALLIIIYLLLMWQIWVWVKHQTIIKLAEDGRSRINLYVTHLKGQLEKYKFLPELLSTNPKLIELLQDPGNSDSIDALNRYLETINSITNASDTYLMDHEGLTIAASNWQSERPFVGRNFSYRPYFQKAMQGQLGRYFALGTTSKRRGYYFAYPVRNAGKILGAVVIKVDISQVESNWQGRPEQVIVTDPDGVIFITTNPEWRFRSIKPMDKKVLNQIIESKRYPDTNLQNLHLLKEQEVINDDIHLYKFSEKNSGDGYIPQRWYLHTQHGMPEAGWKFHLLTPLKLLYTQLLEVQAIASLIFAVIVFLALFILQRRKRMLDRNRYEKQARETLRKAHDLLEQRVLERTKALQHEIEERSNTENELRKTQDQLIQSAKLAVIGQLSAGISHELNQPLAAIRSYADNARLFLDKERRDDAVDNLNQIAELTERMAQINSQLKLFARKKSSEYSSISIVNAIEAARRLLRPQFKKTATELLLEIPEQANVWVNQVQLEQVLVNLFSNAMNAMENKQDCWIKVLVLAKDKFMVVTIQDNGPGIPQDILDQIFSPFFTTREAGLGLGLSISRRIATTMGGDLEATNHLKGGAIFTLTLPTAKESVDVIE